MLNKTRTAEQRARHAAAQRKSYYKKKYGAESKQFAALESTGFRATKKSRTTAKTRTAEQRARHAAAQRKSYYKKKYGAESKQFAALESAGFRATKKNTRKPLSEDQRKKRAYKQRKVAWMKQGLDYTDEYKSLTRKEKEGNLTAKDIEEGFRLKGKNKKNLIIQSLSNELVEEYGTSGTEEDYSGTHDEIIDKLRTAKRQKQADTESYNYYLKEGLEKYQEKKRQGAWNV